MMWALLIVLSARSGFGSNIEGGIASQVIEFKTEAGCREAAKEIQLVNGNRGFFISTTCVEKK